MEVNFNFVKMRKAVKDVLSAFVTLSKGLPAQPHHRRLAPMLQPSPPPPLPCGGGDNDARSVVEGDSRGGSSDMYFLT